MCSIPIQPKNPIRLKEKLFNAFKIEIPITNFLNNYYLRVSIQAYNSQEDIDTLTEAIQQLKQQGEFN